MFTVPEQVMATHKENLETFLELAGVTAAGAEKLVDLNLKTAKTLFAEASKNAKALAEIKDAQEFSALQSDWVQPAGERISAYVKHAYAVLSETQSELSKLVEGRIAEFNKNVTSALDQAVKNAPVGSEVAIAAVKSAMAAANQAYDAISKATKQVADATEATVTATANTPAKKKAA